MPFCPLREKAQSLAWPLGLTSSLALEQCSPSRSYGSGLLASLLFLQNPSQHHLPARTHTPQGLSRGSFLCPECHSAKRPHGLLALLLLRPSSHATSRRLDKIPLRSSTSSTSYPSPPGRFVSVTLSNVFIVFLPSPLDYRPNDRNVLSIVCTDVPVLRKNV